MGALRAYKMLKYKSHVIHILFIVFALISSVAHGADATRIDDVTVSRDPVKASFSVKGAFTKEIEEAVKSGMPTTFNFIVELSRVSSILPDDLLVRREFQHTVKYDSLKDEYEMTLEDTGEKVRTKEFSEMKRLMSSVQSLPLAGASRITSGSKYEIRIMAELDPVELPMVLNYMLFFVKFWDFETDWYVYTLTP